MSALYTAVGVHGSPWSGFRRPVELDAVADLLAFLLPLGEHTGLLRLDTGEEVGFRAKASYAPGGFTDLEILVDDAHVADVARLTEEVARLRAALSAIAALQAEEPEDTSEETGERFDSRRDAYESGEMDGYRAGQWDAAEMARVALGAK